MKFRIQHYYGQEPPTPDAVKTAEAEGKFAAAYEVEIDDLQAWIAAHKGAVIVSPPGAGFDEWFIWVTDGSNKFRQK